jgi:LacI family kdg operon repressor
VDLMQQDPEKMGQQAAKRLLQQIQHPKAVLQAVELISAIRVKGHSF